MNSRLPLSAAALLLANSCAGLATNMVADALSEQGTSFSSDDDPELVRSATPFGLKATEATLAKAPRNEKLLLSAASGFTQYAYAFVQQDADMSADERPDYSRAQYARARKLYARAHEYALRALEVRHEGFRAQFDREPAKAAALFKDKQDAPYLYWTAASLAAWIALSKDNMQMVGRLPQVEALMGRAYALDPDWDDGSIHEFYITYDGGRSEAMGGSVARAREHYDRVLQLTNGRKLGPYLTWAEVVDVQKQDRKDFNALIDKVLAFDVDEAPQFRLVNVITQNRARWLRAHADDLFVEE